MTEALMKYPSGVLWSRRKCGILYFHVLVCFCVILSVYLSVCACSFLLFFEKVTGCSVSFWTKNEVSKLLI